MIFNPEPVDVAAIEEARQLAWRAGAVWFAAWIVPPAVSLLSFGPQRGEMAALGAIWILAITLVIGLAGTVVSFRYGLRALNLDPQSVLSKAVIGLNLISMLWVLIVGGLTLSVFVS